MRAGEDIRTIESSDILNTSAASTDTGGWVSEPWISGKRDSVSKNDES